MILVNCNKNVNLFVNEILPFQNIVTIHRKKHLVRCTSKPVGSRADCSFQLIKPFLCAEISTDSSAFCSFQQLIRVLFSFQTRT